MSRGSQFCITHNNYTATDLQHYRDEFTKSDVVYAVLGQEVAPTTGTRHLQGYVCFNSRKRIGAVRSRFPGAHIEVARATAEQNRDYCTKDGDFTEFGCFAEVPFQGKRTDLDKFKQWLTEQTEWPTDSHIALNFPTLYIRYPRILELRNLLYPPPKLETDEYREGWQSDLASELEDAPVDDRKITFYVDEEGGTGKSWFCRKFFTDNPKVQLFSVGKRDDIAHAIDITTRVFLFNIPRQQMQYLQYGLLESIKDRVIFSPKYCSKTKFLLSKPHVVVFCNEHPDEEKLSADRFDIRII